MISTASINAYYRRAHTRKAAPRLLAQLGTRMCHCSLLAPIEFAHPQSHARLSPLYFTADKRMLDRFNPIEIP
jgi:hypothetical protein